MAGIIREEVIGKARLLLGDCRDILPTISGVDLIFTSPPYNLGNTSGGGFSGHGKWSGGALATGYEAFNDALPHSEYVVDQHSVLRACWETLSDTGAIFYNHKVRILNGIAVTPLEYNPGLPVRQIIIWARAGGVNFSPAFYLPTHEWIVLICKPDFRLRDRAASGVGDVWYVAQESGTEHPAPFPISLPRKALETTTAETVLDPYMGSGTTGVATIRAGRRFIGIEREPKYFEIAVRRIREANGDDAGPLFGEAA